MSGSTSSQHEQHAQHEQTSGVADMQPRTNGIFSCDDDSESGMRYWNSD